jgi:molybdopterin-guanine dinucleotide biosynthesis protein A
MVQDFSSVLLAAGRSTRMGREKALLEVDGAPMWKRQRDLLAAAGAAEIFLSARPDQAWARETVARGEFAAVLHDAMPSAGPLCGITAAIERAAHGHIAVLAIDLPKMEPEWLGKLLADCAPSQGTVGRHGDFFEPLAAIYPREIMPLAWAALSGGRYALQPLIVEAVEQRLLRVREIGREESAWFENWNEPNA